MVSVAILVKQMASTVATGREGVLQEPNITLAKEFLPFYPFILLMLITRDCDFLGLGTRFFWIRTFVLPPSPSGVHSKVVFSRGFPASLFKTAHVCSPFYALFFQDTRRFLISKNFP